MSKKILLTSEQSHRLMNHIVSEMVNEGAWENIKYGLSKLTTTNSGGKLNDAAKEKIRNIINKTGNEVIKKLHDEIARRNPEFPNNQKGIDFLISVMSIAAVYDSIILATTFNPNDTRYLPPDAANGIIDDLREYVKKILETDLKNMYSVVDEIEGNVIDLDEASATDIRQYLQGKELPIAMAATDVINLPISNNGSLTRRLAGGAKNNSRRQTLTDLLNSIKNINGGFGIFASGDQGTQTSPEETPEVTPEPIVPRETEPTTAVTQTNTIQIDDIYNSLRNLFKFIVGNRASLGIRSVTNTYKGAGTYFHKMKTGDKVFYNGKPVTIVTTNTGVPNKTQVQYQNGVKMAVDSDKLTKLQESILYEGRYIKNKQLYQTISKGVTNDKLISFEEFMNRIEQLRDKIRALKSSNDKVLDRLVWTIKQNPLMATDFKKIFNVAPDNTKVISTMISFINKLLSTVYSGNFKNGELMGKISKNMNEAMDPTAFAKVAQDRSMFNQNLINFLSEAIGLYQYLVKKKSTEASNQQNVSESVGAVDSTLLNEELKRITKIMHATI